MISHKNEVERLRGQSQSFFFFFFFFFLEGLVEGAEQDAIGIPSVPGEMRVTPAEITPGKNAFMHSP